MIGSCIVAWAFTRQVSLGSFEGKKTVKPILAFTSDQSVIVLGVPGTVVGVLPTVLVAVVPEVVAAVVVVAVARGVEIVVVVGVGVTAPSSRKSNDGFLHQ